MGCLKRSETSLSTGGGVQTGLLSAGAARLPFPLLDRGDGGPLVCRQRNVRDVLIPAFGIVAERGLGACGLEAVAGVEIDRIALAPHLVAKRLPQRRRTDNG